eukprot:1141629-Pelagomonas_calceolata.AAC.9
MPPSKPNSPFYHEHRYSLSRQHIILLTSTSGREECARTHLMVAPLGWHDDAADLLDLWVVRRAHAIHEASDLGAEVRDADELLQQVLGHHKTAVWMHNSVAA